MVDPLQNLKVFYVAIARNKSTPNTATTPATMASSSVSLLVLYQQPSSGAAIAATPSDDPTRR